MPPKASRPKKKTTSSKKIEATVAVVEEINLEDETPADKLRREGVIATFAGNANSKSMHRNVRDISVSNLTCTFNGVLFVEDAELTLNYGNRYGYIGRNGCGKSTFMKVIAARCFPIPDGIDIFHLKEEIEPTEMTAKEAVMSVDVERAKLEEEAEILNEGMADEGTAEADDIIERLTQIYERLEEMDAATAETRASKILSGLGFTPETQQKKTKDFSGGWRMRIALARALFIQPTLLLLDEPTNHLDMEAVVWLEDYLSKWDKILFLVSHSQDFLNNVCTHMVHHKNKVLTYYTGNYDSFINTRSEKEEEQTKRFKLEQDQIQHMKDYVAKFGQGNSKMAKQAQSKEKILNKMLAGGVTDKVEVEKPLDFKFADPGGLSPPVLQCNDITFGYPGCEILYTDVDFGIDLDSRVALVGPNGAGKSTLLKIMTGELMPITGAVRPHVHLRISKFSQHFIDVLDLTMTPLDYFLSLWTDMTREDGRKFLGRFGISGPVQTQVMQTLSDGQKSRVVLAKMAKENPHVLFLDEPTNHLDMESIDSLAKAINSFTGGLVLVSHDMRLISQVAKEIWMCDNKTVTKFTGEISDFKMHLKREMVKNNLIDADASMRNTAPVDVRSMFVPLAPLKAYNNDKGFTGKVAPMVDNKKSKEMTEEELIRKTRLELADLAIARMRERQAEEAAALAGKNLDAPTTENIKKEEITVEVAMKSYEEEEEEKRKEEEKALIKERRKVERAAKAALLKEEEEMRRIRKAEKEKDILEAKELAETKRKEHEIFLIQKAERDLKKANAEKEEEERLAAALAARQLARKEAKEARKEARKLAEEQARLAAEQKVLADPFTQEEQIKFEDALLENTPDLDKILRWKNISEAVGKTRNQCLARYVYLKQFVETKKGIAAKEKWANQNEKWI
jgi:ATP-binding cassette subfamily F protein 2